MSQSPPDDFPPDDATIPTPPAKPRAYADDDADALREWVARQAGRYHTAATVDALRRGTTPPPPMPLLPPELMPSLPPAPRGAPGVPDHEVIAKSDAAYAYYRGEFRRDPTRAEIAAFVPLSVQQWRRRAKELGYQPPA